MTTEPPSGVSPEEQAWTQERVRAFKTGNQHAKDPANSGHDGPARTTGDSLWFDLYCRVCGHTFRRGDAVYVVYRGDDDPDVRHQSPELPCAPLPDDVVAEPVRTDRVEVFYAAADRANPPRQGLHLTRLQPGHPLLVDVIPRRHCVLCCQSFRPFELAVVCPCSPAEPRCGLGVHRDAGRGLVCYDSWTVQGALTRCPTNLQKLDGS
ncbi:hypothetical protein ACFYW8_21680 [Streptomyces sp. NPDC002742]|jgi:hypothetical protein|uniref:hypothetical protein n=1 Tax=unclassified Streptomyces TaxID=2593676 RepID=UPI00341D9CC1